MMMLAILIIGHILLITGLALITLWVCVGGVVPLIAGIWLLPLGIWLIASYCFKRLIR